MNTRQATVLQRLLSGIAYLADEADRNGLAQVARIFRLCAKDVEALPNDQNELFQAGEPGAEENNPSDQL